MSRNPHYPIPVCEVASGEIVWECQGGVCAEIEILNAPTSDEWGWRVKVHTPFEAETTFGHAHEYAHYGPRFYAYPCYARVQRLDGTESVLTLEEWAALSGAVQP